MYTNYWFIISIIFLSYKSLIMKIFRWMLSEVSDDLSMKSLLNLPVDSVLSITTDVFNSQDMENKYVFVWIYDAKLWIILLRNNLTF